GETAVLYNADDVSETDFIAAWGLGMNLIAVGNWQALSLNNGGDTIGLWESFASYEGDNESQINAIISVAYPNIDDGSGSIFLTDLTDGDSFALSTDGLASPAGGPAYISRMMGGNSGSDIGSPGGFISSVETPIASNPGFFQFAGGLSGLSGAEITAFDPLSNRLFVVDGSASLQIFDFSDPTNPTALGVIDVSGFGSAANSVSIRNGIVAVAIAAEIETDLGTVAFYKASDGMLLDSVVVGALPDFVTFTKNGTQALVANEGQPNGDIDPDGSVSVIDFDGTTVTNIATADFDSFDAATLRAAGVRIFPGKTVAQDVEPEYIALSDDGTTAFVALQENNAIAVVTIATATISEVRPLGTQDHSIMGNELDASDGDDIAGNLRTQPLFGLYQPDAIATFTIGTETYTITANEGDARSEDERVGNLILDPTAFPNAATLQLDENLGRILVSTIDGDIDNDGDFDQLFSYGSRSFTIRDAAGDIVFDSGNQLEAIAFANVSDPSGFDGRSDNKGPEPEGVTVGTINDRTYAFIGLERAEGVAVYDVTVPSAPIFVQYLTSPGDSEPEGLTFVEAADSPNGANLLILANEDSNTISVYSNGAQQALTLTEFILVNADTNTDIMEINEGVVINLGSLPTKNLAIRAEGTDDIESVSFQLSGPQNQINTENFEPYALFGDNTGNFAANQFLLGKYDLVAIPFSEDDLGGLAGNPLSLSFEFIEADVPNLQITEIWPGNTNGSNLTADWFEITNNGAGAWTPDIGVLAFDDDSQDVTTADVISGITSIQPGETVIAIDDSNITEFLEVWASVYDLTDVQIGTYDGSGLSGNGDGVTLFVNGEIVDFEAYPASTNGASYDVGLSAFSEVGVGPNLPVATTILSDLGEPAIGSPGNQGPTGDTGMLSIVSFTLVDANTNQDILNVIDGDSINLANLPTSFINIRANTSNDAMSVRFVLTGEINSIGTENVEPYALFGDIGGNYRGRTLLSGNYSLTVTAFSEEDLQGMEGTPITINFEVFEDNQPQIPQVIGFTLVDADTDEDMLDLVDGIAINLTELPNTFANIRANTSMGTMSVRLQLSGAQNQDMTENVAPYALFGDNAGDYRGNTFIVGNYTLTATAFSEDNLDGLSGNPLTINFEIFEEIIVPSGQAQVNTLSIYPNPAKVAINASFETPSEIEQIMVFDMIGRLVQTYDAKRIKEGNAYRLDVDSLPSGNYILKTLDKRGNSSQKQMVIEK
ncbi:MAG: choice-of-anchor I family protein, partial [Bacteroidota bacterium]